MVCVSSCAWLTPHSMLVCPDFCNIIQSCTNVFDIATSMFNIATNMFNFGEQSFNPYILIKYIKCIWHDHSATHIPFNIVTNLFHFVKFIWSYFIRHFIWVVTLFNNWTLSFNYLHLYVQYFTSTLNTRLNRLCHFEWCV